MLFNEFVMVHAKKETQFIIGRIDTPAFHRNSSHIVEVLKSEFGAGSGNILEIASGSGQHVAVFANTFPEYIFWPSDLNPDHIRSIEAWRRDAAVGNLRSPFKLDVLEKNWGIGEVDRPPDGLDAIININMVHISPIETAENLFKRSSVHLRINGKLILYGPFKKNGKHTAPSNAEFDNRLRSSNPSWGVRDIEEVSAFANFNQLALDRLVPMPSNNLMLVFGRSE
jgi:hypothetical protein